ncbi:MAG: GyrI-like domain-containing protein [Candidatus Aminicenantes bacterium]|nr:GyrI-like domain-containing protein [Candidatus Aminicenantes bacterium]
MKKTIFAVLVCLVFTGLMLLAEETTPTPVVKEVEACWYAYMEFSGPYSDMQKGINTFMTEFFGQGLIPGGPALCLYFNSPETVKPEELKWTFGFVVSPEAAPKEPVKKMEMKKQLALVYLHKGPYDNLPKSYEIAFKFIKDNGYKITGPVCDRYLNNPMEVIPGGLETEIVIPVDKK